MQGSEVAVLPRPMPPGLKRWIVRTHAYLGVAFAALSVMWFASGIVLAYNTFPMFLDADRLRLAPPLDCAACRVSEAEARRVAGIPDHQSAPARLGMIGTRPVWRIVDGEEKWHAAFADSAVPVPPVDSIAGADIAIAFVRRMAPATATRARASYGGTLRAPDQWTLEQPMPSQLPLLRFDVTDDAGTRVYVSQSGAEVVTTSTRHQRTMAWLGAIPHWIYPTLLRRHVQAWSLSIIALSALGTLMSLAGLTIGVWQWRWRVRRRRDGTPKPRTPYREFMMRWHHLLGLVFGLFTCSWMFSGLMSMNPGEWSPGSTPRESVRTRWSGADGAMVPVQVAAADAWRVMRAGGHAVNQMQLNRIADQPYWMGAAPDGHGVLVRADSIAASTTVISEADLIRNATRSLGGAHLLDAALLDAGDDYFRETPEHRLTSPVLRLRFDDPAATWVYVDPATAALRGAFEARSRRERWLYSGLHDLDFRWLLEHRPLWDVVIVGLSVGGLLGALSGAVLAIRWLRDARRPAPRFRRR